MIHEVINGYLAVPELVRHDYFHVADNTTINSGNSTPVVGVSLTITAAEFFPNAKYLVVWSAEAGASTGAVLETVALRWGGAAKQQCNPRTYDLSPQDWHPVGGFWVFDAGAVPATTTFDIAMNNDSGVGTTMTRNHRLTLLKLGADDQYALQGTQQSTSSLSFVDAHSLTIAPPTSGDYLVLTSFKYGTDNSASRCDFNIDNGGVSLVTAGHAGFDQERRLVALATRINNLNSSRTIKLQHKSFNGAVTSHMDDMAIVAMRLDRFEDVYSTILAAESAGTEATDTAGLSQTFTPHAADHLTMAVFGFEGSDATISSHISFDDGGAVAMAGVREPRVGNSNQDWEGGIGHDLAFYAASSRTQTIYRKSETTGTTTRLKAGAAIVTLNLYPKHAPSFTVQPSITAPTEPFGVDEPLTASPGTHNGASAAYEWLRNAVPIGGATALTYATTSADLGKLISFRVTATNIAGSTSATTNASGAVVTPTRYDTTAIKWDATI